MELSLVGVVVVGVVLQLAAVLALATALLPARPARWQQEENQLIERYENISDFLIRPPGPRPVLSALSQSST